MLSLSVALIALSASATIARAQSSWNYIDVGQLDGSFVGPANSHGSAITAGQAFTSKGGFDVFNYGGSNIYDLGSFGTGSSETFFVDALGQVAGQTPGSANQAFYFAAGNALRIGTLGGSGSYVTGMSASGEVIGYSDTVGNASTRAFAYTPSALIDIGTLGGSTSVATAINSSGQVVGSAYLSADAASHAFLFSNGSLRDLGTLGGSNSSAVAINAAGQVVGNSYTTGNAKNHAFLYGAGTLKDLGTLGGSFSAAIGINARGQVVGNSYSAGDSATHAFLYSNGAMNDLGTLGGSNSFAIGVNSLGQVIGLSDIAGNRGQHAFLYSAGRMVDLDNPIAGITGFFAAGINDAMQIVGYGLTATGLKRAFVISPVPGAPGGLCMLFGMATIGAVARRRRFKATPSVAYILGGPAQRVRVDVLGARIDVVDQQQAVALLLAWGKERSSRTVCACNVHSVVTARRDKSLARAIAGADLAVADGAPVAWLMRKQGHKMQRRVCGPDLMWSYLEGAAAAGQSIFLYGSTEAKLQRLRSRICERFPRLVVAGMYAPPFGDISEDEDCDIVNRINASGAASVWIALGCPKQEAWIAAHRGRVAAVMVGVGAAFDFHAGTLRRAPAWMRTIGAEWLHRLASEPRRLGRRYMVTNTIFIAATVSQLILGRARLLAEWASLIAPHGTLSHLDRSPQAASS